MAEKSSKETKGGDQEANVRSGESDNCRKFCSARPCTEKNTPRLLELGVDKLGDGRPKALGQVGMVPVVTTIISYFVSLKSVSHCHASTPQAKARRWLTSAKLGMLALVAETQLA